MDIYRDYTTLDVMYDLPCNIQNCGLIYPIKIRDYIKFLKGYNLYFTYTPKYLKALVPDEIKQGGLSKTILLMYGQKSQPDEFSKSKSENEILLEIVNELEEVFSIITKQNITYNNGSFTGKDVIINDKNFDFVKKVVALSNVIYQPNYYEDKEFAKVMEKARKAHNKGGISFDEMIAYVKNNGKLTYEEVMNQNVLQFYADYNCQANNENYRTMMTFGCVSDDKSIKKTKLTPAFMNKLFENSDSSLLITLGDLGF